MILKLIKEEGLDENNVNEDGNLKSQPIIQLIEDFQKNYQSFDDQYDNHAKMSRKKK